MFISAFLLIFACQVNVNAADNQYTNSIGIEFVLIPSGSFIMGAKTSSGAIDLVWPQHTVKISTPFYLGKYEVTQDQWEKVMGNNPSHFKGSMYPVDQVSWEDVVEFIEKLNKMEGHNRYRLPTEAEWEYAARSGTTELFFFGDNDSVLYKYAWYEDNSNNTTHPVGQKEPNNWGLYDINGNVREWVQDWYEFEYYFRTNSLNDPKGPLSGEYRVSRGGSWDSPVEHCRVFHRDFIFPYRRKITTGFRLVLSIY
jgi:formylglycine-generating enzyme required for sulfatase activity